MTSGQTLLYIDAMAKQEQIALRTEKPLKESLQALADQDGRTLSNYILNLLAKHVEEAAHASAKAKGKGR